MKDGCFIHEPSNNSPVVGSAAPLTPGGQSSQMLLQNHSSTVGASTPNTTTTALGVGGSIIANNNNLGESGRTNTANGITNFWNNHTQPHATLSPSNGGDGSQQSNAASFYIKPTTKKPPSSLSMAAADAVLGLITKAEAFLVSTTGVSPSNGSGLCGSSPTMSSSSRPESGQRSSSAPANLNNSNDLAGIPEGEDEHTTNSDKLGFCGNLNTTGVGGCFEFEDFGFNAFQDNSDRYYDTKVNTKAQQDSGIKEDKRPPSDGPPQQALQTSPSELNQPKGYEIRLKSSFSQLKAKEDKDKSSNPPSAFGRTHPNNNNNTNTNYKKSKSHPNITTKEQNEDYGSSRALPDGLPFRELSVPSEIEHSVSELTMRSHGAFERHKYTSDSRRMAYYAVGRTTSMNNNDESGSRKSSSGGNRRCYFTGHSILYGMPFYAGSVQQGPRTLVVFCLPSALGLGTKENKNGRPIAKFSSKVERDRYLESLPDPDTKLLQEMSKRYPEPFDTLPVQVRSPHCWRLFVKFCFFSGLPIAEGEMHYRVKSTICVMASQQQQQQKEEIALSHEVMEGELCLDLYFSISFVVLGYPMSYVFSNILLHLYLNQQHPPHIIIQL